MESSFRNIAAKGWLRTIGATILLTIVGSACWEMIARPGLGWLGRNLLLVLSLASTTVRDLPYSTAAFDPGPLPSLILFMFFCQSTVVLLALPLLDLLLKPRLWKFMDRRAGQVVATAKTSEAAQIAMHEWITRSRRRIRWAQVVLGLVLFLTAQFGYSIVNQATLVRRTIVANITILEPHVGEPVAVRLRATFAAMTTKSDFASLFAEIDSIASANSVRLRQETGSIAP